jgi:hypothetical protein
MTFATAGSRILRLRTWARATLWQADIEAVGVALKGKLITPEQALELKWRVA